MIKWSYAIVFLFLLPLFVSAQNGVYFIPSDKETDSVRIALSKTTNDTLKMLAYYYLSSYYTEINKDSSIYYAELQLQSAQTLQQKLWVADAYFQIAYLAFGLSNYPKSLSAVTDGLAITNDAKLEQNNWQISTFSGDDSAYKARLFIASSLHQVFAFYTRM